MVAWRALVKRGTPGPIDVFAGGIRVREYLNAGSSVSGLIDAFQATLCANEQQRAPHLFYTD
jgi:hypothetical protein